MGVKITNRSYKNQFYPASQKTNWLLGNVGDWQRLEIDFEVLINFKASQQESVNIDVDNQIISLNNGKKWSDYGFDIGDTVEFTYKRDVTDGNGNTNTTSHVANILIQNLYDDVMEHDTLFTAQHILSIGTIPTDRGSEKFYNVEFKVKKECEGLKFRYSHLTNEDYQSDNLASFIDGSITEFSFAGINNLTTNVDTLMNPDGIQSGMAIDEAFIRRISYNASTGVGTYRIACHFMLASFFEQISNLETLTPPSILFNAGSLTDNFEVVMFPEWNNPNTSISNDLDHTERLGNTGWFNENFNGLDNNFEIESILYYDDNGNALAQLDYSNPVNVEVVINGINNLSSSSEFGLGFAWIPSDEESYHNKMTPFHQNLYVSTGRKFASAGSAFNLNQSTGTTIYQGDTAQVGRMNIQATQSVLFSANGTKAVMRARFIPTADFTAEFEGRNEDDRKYILWVSVADHNLQINFSDRVSLLIDYNEMVKVIPPSGPFPTMTNRFLEHPQDEDVNGVEKYFGFVEDDILARLTFSVDTQDNKTIRSMVFGYEVENTQTGLAYELERYNVNLTTFPADNDGVQNFNFDAIRGFKMEDGNNKNWVKVLRDSDNDNGTSKAYKAYFATKIRWEDWIARDGVYSEYFNSNLENNGYHNDWLDYLRAIAIGMHKINFFVLTEVIENGEYKVYKNTYELTFNDYDENLNIETDHHYFRDSDNTLLNIGTDPDTGKPLGVILNNEPTRIEITYTNLTGDFDISKMYAVTTMEVDKGAGRMEHRQLSSVWGSESDNFLIPLNGELMLKFEQISSNVVKASCLVDPAKLDDAERYKISGRIGCYNNPNIGLYDLYYSSEYE